MKKIICYILSMVAALMLAYGCSDINGKTSDSPVIAKVGKGVITESEFLKEVQRVPEWARTQFGGIEGKGKFLDELIKRELIYQHAKKMKLDNDSDYQEKVDNFKKITLVSMVIKREVEDRAVVDESEIKDFFDKNTEKLTIGTKLKASHILVATEDEAKEISAQIKNGASFAKLAKEKSIDKGSAAKGGDLGYFEQGKMVPEFERAAASLKQGEVSEPVRTRFGYHIIKLTGVKKGKPASFEQSKEAIRKQLLAQKKKKFFDTFVNDLEKEISISRDKDALASLKLPWDTKEEAAPSGTAAQEAEGK